MPNTVPLTRQIKTQFLFNVKLEYQSNDSCILSSAEREQKIEMDVHSKLGQHSKKWNPEQLMLGALESCYLSTLNYYLKKRNISIEKFNCEAIGSVQWQNEKLIFIKIDVYPNIYLKNADDQLKMTDVLQQTQKNCLIANTLNTEIIYHNQVFNSSISNK